MICFVIAMEKEARPVIEAITKKTEKTVYGKTVVTGELFGKNVSVIICGVGKVNAASGAQYAIDVLRADKIINLGVAGALNGDMNVGGVYSITHAVQYDFDLTQINGTEIGTLDEFEENWLSLSINSSFPRKRLATGDRFNDSAEDYKLLTDVLRADIRDMEGGAIAQVCAHSNTEFYSYKIISDVAGSESTPEQYFQNLDKCFLSLKDNLAKIFNEVQ